MRSEKNPNKAPVMFHMPTDLRKKLRLYCIDNGISMDSFCAEAVIKKVTELDKKPTA